MADNFTRAHKLVEEISDKGWLANLAGRDGYEIILLKKVGGGGARFHCILKPGEALRWSELIFDKYEALAVDVRHTRSFSIEGRYVTCKKDCEVAIKANVYYHVYNSRIVALEAVDPLGALRKKVIGTLNRELAHLLETDINPGCIEQIIHNVGRVHHLGLKVDGADVIEFTPSSRLVKEEKILLLKEHRELAQKAFTAFAERDQMLLKARLGEIKPAIEDYITRQKEIEEPIDPQVILQWLDLAAMSAGP